MSRTQKMFNKPTEKPILPDKKNFDGFPAFSTSIYEQYVQMVMVNTIGNTYYMDAKDLFTYSIALHEKMKDTDPGFMARAIIYARNFGMMRMQPIVGLAYLSTAPNKKLFNDAFNKVIKTPGDLTDFVSVIGSVRKGKGFGRAVKRSINNWLVGSAEGRDGLSEYHAIKYGGGGNGTKWTLDGVIKEAHPTPKDAMQSALFKYLTKGVNNPNLIQINAIEALKRLAAEKSTLDTATFTNRVNALINEGRLPYEIVTGIIKPTVEIWEHLMRQMPIFALVRHLNTLEKEGVFNKPANVDFAVEKITNPEIVSRSRMLPFSFYTAYTAYNGNLKIQNALKSALDISLSNIDMIPGKNAFYLDVSGSMTTEYLTIGGLLGLAALKKSSDSTFLCFGSELKMPLVDVNDTVLTNIQKCRDILGGGTATDLCVAHLLGTVDKGPAMTRRTMLDNRPGTYADNFPQSQRTTSPTRVDNIIIITDGQQNIGKPVVEVFRQYRRQVNKDAKMFIVNIGPYSAQVASNNEPGVTFIHGWNESVLNVMKYAMDGSGSHVEQIKKMRL